MRTKRHLFPWIAALLCVCLFSGCKKEAPSASLPAGVLQLTGAGATFPAPLYKKWIEVYQDRHPDILITYEAVGSGEGTQRFMNASVDFGASDSAMTDAQMQSVKNGARLIPVTAGSIVLAYHIEGLNGQLKLPRGLYVDIFGGKIQKWNDPRIIHANPGLNLPDKSIVLVARNDGSGTTWAFTHHLSTISAWWREKGPGEGKKIAWPQGTMNANGNGGVAAKIKVSDGTIGYVEYGYAKRAGLAMAVLENKAGKFITPSDTSSTATLANTRMAMPKNLRLFMPDPEGDTSYPIVTYSWLLLNQSYENPKKSEQLKRFVTWGLTEGQRYADEFGYAPLPADVTTLAIQAVEGIS